MSAPPKPWEQRNIGVNQRQSSFLPDQTNSFQSTLVSNINGGGGGGGQIQPVAPPPLPPAPSSSMNNYPGMGRPAYSSYGGYGGGYGSYGATSMYGGAYGNYGGYNRFGMGPGMPPHPIDNGFIQLAEESSRPAFQSIESIVHAFGSVSMMLESTYHAVHSSFRAVLGVAEHFTRMKSQFAQIFSAFAVVRTLRWLYKKLLYLIGLRMQNPSMEDVWRGSAAAGSAAAGLSGEITEADLKASKSSWPIFMFFAVVFGGPYLIWRLLSSITPAAAAKSKSWLTGQGEHYAATATYEFKGRSKNELGFQRGQPLILAPKDQQPSVRGWLLASDGRRSGLVPANYIKIIGLRKPKPATNNGTDTAYGVQQLDASSSTGLPSGGVRPDGRLVAPGIPGIPRGGSHGQPSGPSQATTQQLLSSQPLPSQQHTTQHPITTQPTTISYNNSSEAASHTNIAQQSNSQVSYSKSSDAASLTNTYQQSIVPNLESQEIHRNTPAENMLTNTLQQSKDQNLGPQTILTNPLYDNSSSQIIQPSTSQGSVPSETASAIFDTSSE